MRKFNVKFFLILTLSLVLTGVGVFFLHRFQHGRIGEALLWQVQRAEEAGRLDQMIRFLGLYLELHPQDLDQQARLGETLASENLKASLRTRLRAVFVLEQVLLKDPNREAQRRTLVRLALGLGRYELAQQQLEWLLKLHPDEAELQQRLGQSHAGQNRPREAAECYRAACRLDPTRIDSYVLLADLLHAPPGQKARPDDDREADQVMDDLIRNNPDNHRAYLARWLYHKKFDNLTPGETLDRAGRDVQRALELTPDDLEVLLAGADLAQLKDDRAGAIAHLQRGLQLHPEDGRVIQNLAWLEYKDGKFEEAVECLRQGADRVAPQDRSEVLWTLANLLIDRGRIEEADPVIVQLRKAGPYPPSLDYLQGRVLFHHQRWNEAAQVFERVRPLLESTPELTWRIDLFLGHCYDQLDDPGRQLTAFTRILTRDPTLVAARVRLAAALRAQGRLTEALEQYRQVSAAADAPAGVWLEIARLQLVRAIQAGKGSWKELDEALDRAREAQPDAPEVTLLAAEIHLAKGQPDRADQTLAEAQKKDPRQIEFPAARAIIATRDGNLDQARQLLADAREACGDSVVWRLARGRLLTKGKDGPASLLPLADDLDAFKAEDQARLLQGLAEESLRSGQAADARQLWERLAQLPEHGQDLRLRLLLFNLALQAGDRDGVAAMLAEFRRIEGGPGPLGRYAEARQLMAAARQGQPHLLDQARVLLDAAAAQRPGWGAVVLAKAQIDEQKGSAEPAIANYRRAIELGERNPRVFRHLVDLLVQRQRFEEAQQEIQKLQKQGPLPADLKRLSVAVSLRNHETAQAVQMALDTVTEDSQDYRDYVWLGQVLAAGGQDDAEAEAKLRRAVELAETVPEPWVALVQFLASRQRKKDAAEVIDQIAQRLPAREAPLALARCQEAIGQRDQALARYQALVDASPDESGPRRALAEFLVRGPTPHQAEPHLRKLLDPQGSASATDRSWARRSLALVLADRADPASFQEAARLVGLGTDAQGRFVPPADSTPEPEEQRARARVLSQHHAREARQLALTLLEGLQKRAPVDREDQFLMARLYESTGAWPRARDLLRSLTAGNDLQPAQLVWYIQALFRHKDLPEAQRQTDRLVQLEKALKVEPGSLGSAEFRALVLLARQQGDQGLAILEEFARAKDDRPERKLLVASYLARMERVDQALEWCARARPNCPAELFAAACVSAVRVGKGGPASVNRVEGWLKQAIEADPNSTALLIFLADLKDAQGQYQEQEALYRRVLEREPGHAMALNNLAWLLAHRPGTAPEALTLIDRAIAAAGPRAEFLDTRAHVLMAIGQPDQSVRDLLAVTAETAAPASYLRLAWAHQRAGNRPAALAALKQARGKGLEVSQLHPLDRPALQKVVEELER